MTPHSLHPSFIYRPFRVMWGWSQSQLTLGERVGSPWTGHQSIAGPTYRDKLFIDPWDLGRNMENITDTGRTSKHHTKRPWPAVICFSHLTYCHFFLVCAVWLTQFCNVNGMDWADVSRLRDWENRQVSKNRSAGTTELEEDDEGGDFLGNRTHPFSFNSSAIMPSSSHFDFFLDWREGHKLEPRRFN